VIQLCAIEIALNKTKYFALTAEMKKAIAAPLAIELVYKPLRTTTAPINFKTITSSTFHAHMMEMCAGMITT
jgi:hypothetical protein